MIKTLVEIDQLIHEVKKLTPSAAPVMPGRDVAGGDLKVVVPCLYARNPSLAVQCCQPWARSWMLGFSRPPAER